MICGVSTRSRPRPLAERRRRARRPAVRVTPPRPRWRLPESRPFAPLELALPLPI